MSFDTALTTGELNGLWKSMLSHKASVRQAMISYATKMDIDESDDWKNPFRALLESYDESLLELQYRLASNLVRAYTEEYAPNLEVDVPTVMRAMVDAITDEESETTTHDKPLVFDAAWIAQYVQEKYLSDKESIAYKQLVSRVYHLIGNFRVNESTIIIPYYTRRWFAGKKIVSEGTKELLEEIDKLTQVVLLGEKASNVQPKQLFGDKFTDSLVESADKSEASIRFMNPESAAKVAAAINESHPNK